MRRDRYLELRQGQDSTRESQPQDRGRSNKQGFFQTKRDRKTEGGASLRGKEFPGKEGREDWEGDSPEAVKKSKVPKAANA